MKSLAEIFEHTLQDVYYAENAITTALPKVAKAAKSADLKKAAEEHLAERRIRSRSWNGSSSQSARRPPAKSAMPSKG